MAGAKVDQRVSSGGGSCARCKYALGLTAQKLAGVWYCGSACAAGRRDDEPRRPAVPEPWLYARPRRFFGARKPKELKSTRPGR